VMLHTTDGVNSQAYLQGGSAVAGRPASADYLITRSGTVLKLIPHGMMAYHAGVVLWGDKQDKSNECSRDLIGIEIENNDHTGQVPTVLQHHAVAGVLLVLAEHYKWSPLIVYGHYGLAWPMGRRSDPHAWDWGYMFWLMAHSPETCQLYGAPLV